MSQSLSDVTYSFIQQPRHLPTSRKTPLRRPLVPPNLLQQRLTPLLFEFSQLLSVVPAFFGILFNIYHIYHPPNSTILIDGRRPPERIDYIISALWVGFFVHSWSLTFTIISVGPFDWLSMPLSHHRLTGSMARVLSSSGDSDPPHIFTSNLLARDSFHTLPTRA